MDEITSEGLRLSAHYAKPHGTGRFPTLILLPGFPRGTGGAAMAGNTYPQFVERIVRDAGWAALTFQFRGSGSSEGDFSMPGWIADIAAAVSALRDLESTSGIWIAGFRLGGTLAIEAAARDPEIRGIATFAAPASLHTWVPDAARFAQYCRRVGVIHSEDFPPHVGAWGRAISDLDVRSAAAKIAPREWLLVHGSHDDVVSLDHSQELFIASGAQAQLRLVEHGAHRLRHDPRALAMLLGWLDRQTA